MSDLRTRFRSLDRMAAPDLWADVERRIDGMALQLVEVTRPSARISASRRQLAMALLVAALLVALAAGAALVGSRPTSPPPYPLPDLVTEPVEPGVERVLSDGAGHDLTRRFGDVRVGPDGAVRLTRLNRDEMAVDVIQVDLAGTIPAVAAGAPTLDLHFGNDGTAWTASDGLVWSFDGQRWASHVLPDGLTDAVPVEGEGVVPPAGLAVGPDGAAWVTRMASPGPWLGRLDDGGWTVAPAILDPAVMGRYRGGYLAVTPDGAVWLGNGSHHHADKETYSGLLRWDGAEWTIVRPVPGSPELEAGPLAVGPDGTLWVYLDSGDSVPRYLARLDGSGWSTFAIDADVPWLYSSQRYEVGMAVDADGRLWLGGGPDSCGTWRGVWSFDGDTWTPHLQDECDALIASAPDGAVWVPTRGHVPPADAADPRTGSYPTVGPLELGAFYDGLTDGGLFVIRR